MNLRGDLTSPDFSVKTLSVQFQLEPVCALTPCMEVIADRILVFMFPPARPPGPGPTHPTHYGFVHRIKT